ncbi:MAG: DUF5615 family PIN-like protein [Bacteroidia bacterium]
MSHPYRFLIDINLPKFFNYFQGPEFIHQLDLGPDWSDTLIWNYAKENNLIIISRDSDFFFRCMLDPSVKVIHLRLGNIRIREMHMFFEEYWGTIISKIDEAQLLEITRDEIKVVISSKS